MMMIAEEIVLSRRGTKIAWKIEEEIVWFEKVP
jgi:hypothetical protein